VSGLRVGVFTSPHVSSFRERITVNDTMISQNEVTEILEEIFAAMEKHQVRATFFEIATLMSFVHFHRSGVQVAVIECGLGGRLDSTNVITPLLSIITTISLDHCNVLGNTLEEIAREKAGIIKPHVPVLCGHTVLSSVIDPIAADNQSIVSYMPSKDADIPTYDGQNSSLARTALHMLRDVILSDGSRIKLSDTCISTALTHRPKCRMEHIQVQVQVPVPVPVAQSTATQSTATQSTKPIHVVLDVAHNSDGISELIRSLKHQFPCAVLRFVTGISISKDISFVRQLVQHGHCVHLVEGKGPRACPIVNLKQQLIDANIPMDTIEFDLSDPSVASGVRTAMMAAANDANAANAANGSLSDEEVVVICGTFFIMAEARDALHELDSTVHRDAAVDYVDLNEKL
jgi:dihydrofolate synthase / folylpolyglutamate synthase